MWISFRDTLKDYWFNAKDVRCIYCSHMDESFTVSIRGKIDIYFYYNCKLDRDKYYEQLKTLVSHTLQSQSGENL